MDFRYADYFQADPCTGYETLIYDCLVEDPTLSQRADNIEVRWAAVQPILDGWAAGRGGLEVYAARRMPSPTGVTMRGSRRLWSALCLEW